MIIIDRQSKTPLYEQIYSQIVGDIISGRLAEGSILSPIRALAVELGVSKNTIDLAYHELADKGYVTAKKGSGYYVNKVERTYNVDHSVALKNLEGDSTKNSADDNTEKSGKEKLRFIFSAESVSSQEFEWRKWRKCIDESLYDEELRFDGYKDSRGDISLRKSIKKYIFDTRGAKCDVDQIVVCSGTLYALEKAINTIKRFNKEYYKSVVCPDWVEEDIRRVFVNQEMNICEKNGEIIYVSPSHAYPLGHTMTMDERMECIKEAGKINGFIIENDCDSEFINGKSKLPCIQGLSEDDNVIYIGSVSRILSPTIRLAYMVFPKKLLEGYIQYHKGYRAVVPVLHQRTLARYIDLGYMHKHIRALMNTNFNKQLKVMECLKKLETDGLIKIEGVPGGGYIAISCDKDLVTLGRANGIGIIKDGSYYVIGYLMITEEDIDQALLLLENTIKG